MKMCDCDDHLPYAHMYIQARTQPLSKGGGGVTQLLTGGGGGGGITLLCTYFNNSYTVGSISS